MFKNFLIIALRNLVKNKLHSLIAILGLTLGLVAGVIIFIINYSELSWDSWWPDSENIFVVQQTSTHGNNRHISTYSSPLLKNAIAESIHEVAHSGRIMNADISIELIKNNAGQKTSFDDTFYQMDPSMINVFGLTAIKGEFSNFFNNKQAAIITQDAAEKYFGEDDPLGKTLTITGRNVRPGQERIFNINKDYQVVAVIANIPRRNSWSKHGIFVNFTDLTDVGWGGGMVQTYVKLKRAVSLEQVNLSLVQLVDKYVPSSQSNGKKSSDNMTFTLLNIADLHLRSGGQQGNLERIWTLYALAAIIVLLASINYINLTTAHHSRRQKEIALRKTLGSTRLQIIAQFMVEAVVAISIALFLTLVLLEPIMPWLAKVLDMEIESNYLADARLLGSVVAITLLIGIVAGSYPGFYLSNIRPAAILKANRSHEARGSIRLRYFLVLVQFVISIAMLISVALMAKQISTVLNYEPGYETKNIVYLMEHSLVSADRGKINTLKHRFNKTAGVKAVARSGPAMPGAWPLSFTVARVGQAREEARAIDILPIVDADEIDLLHIPIIAGRTFSPFPSDDENSSNLPAQVILDKQALAYLGFKSADEAIGKQLDVYFSEEEKQMATIVAVTADVHAGNRNKPSHPVIFWFPPAKPVMDSIGIRFDGDLDRRVLLESLKEIWESELGHLPSEIFMQDVIKRQYANQIMMSNFVYAFSALAMLISCLGLYGLASFTAEKRTREIGLRKVHGASVRNIVGLLLWQFTKPVVLASIIAWPVSLYLMSRWLENFNQRIDFWLWGPLYCLMAGVVAIVIAWLTVAGHALLVARAKPAKALREE